MIRCDWASYSAIVGGFQLLIQGKLFPSFRSSHSQMFFKIGSLKNLQYSLENTLINFIKKRLRHRCFPVDISNFLKTALFIERLPGGSFWSFNCHVFNNTVQNLLFTEKYEFLLKISKKHTKELLLLLLTFQWVTQDSRWTWKLKVETSNKPESFS